MTESIVEQRFVITVSGRSYWNVVFPALEALQLPSADVRRAGQGVRASFGDLTEGEVVRLAEFLKVSAEVWTGDESRSTAATRILTRVFADDGERVLAQMNEQKEAGR